MAEIRPDMADKGRCISVHWSLPVQCVLSSTHRENWHEAWDPETGNRLRYRRTFGTYATEELRNDEWTALFIPPPITERDEWLAKLADAEADRDRARDAAVALEQQLAAVRALHDERKIREHDPVSGYETGNWWPSICGACSDPAVIETLEIGELIEEGQGQRWPCPTVAIIEGGEAL